MSQAVRIAVIDSGVHADHPHVNGVAGGVAITPDGREENDFVDRLGHDTAVTVVIREKVPDAAIFAVKIFDDSLAARIGPLVRAIDWSLENGMHLINLSLGTSNQEHEPVLLAALKRCWRGSFGRHNEIGGQGRRLEEYMRTAFALMILVGVECFAQVSSSVSLSNGVQLTIACSSSPDRLKIELDPASGNSFYRIFRDENNLAVFVYELQVERAADGDHFRVTAKAAGDDFATRFPNADGGKPAPTLGEPRESPLLASGDHFTIEIPVIPGLAENLSDVIQIRLNQRGTLASQPDSQASAPLRFVGLKVQINDRLASSGGPGATVVGRHVMFYIPGRGGYFLSTEPVENRPFVKIGIVDRTHLNFTLDNDTYDCSSDAPILARSDRGEIWVFHDPKYKPSGNWTRSDPSTTRDEFFAAASDSLKWWLP